MYSQKIPNLFFLISRTSEYKPSVKSFNKRKYFLVFTTQRGICTRVGVNAKNNSEMCDTHYYFWGIVQKFLEMKYDIDIILKLFKSKKQEKSNLCSLL